MTSTIAVDLERVRKLRGARSQVDVAVAGRLGLRTLQRIERGERVRIPTLLKLATGLSADDRPVHWSDLVDTDRDVAAVETVLGRPRR